VNEWTEMKKECFREVLGKVDKKVIWGREREREGRWPEEEREVERGKIRRVLRKLKDGNGNGSRWDPK